MITKSDVFSGQYINHNPILIIKNTQVKKTSIFIILALVFFFVASKYFSDNNYFKDLYAAQFRTDVNMIWEVSRIINCSETYSNIHDFGTAGKVLNIDEISPQLRRVLLNIADADGDNILSENETTTMEIMKINEQLYSAELKRFQFVLSTDRNLSHYVIITKGKYKGTVLYNGNLHFVDGNNNCYLGVELFYKLK